jgi:hypothetical protein
MIESGTHGAKLPEPGGLPIAGVALAAGTVLAWHHPIAPTGVLCAFLLWCAAVACRPCLWLFALPAVLPLLNFAPWTGWVVFEEFDLLLLGAVAGTYAHHAFARRATRMEPPTASGDQTAFAGLAALFGALGAISAFRGTALASDVEFGWFQGYADPLNSWRVFKSLLFAALMWPPLRREIRAGPASAVSRLALGMLVGLAVVSLVVVWERVAYTGLWDFSTPYRTTALFWEMHVGGAAIDAYLALATPFVAWALWTSRSPLRWGAAAVLALLAGYACLTTFSRGIYLALGVSMTLLGLLLARQRVGGDVRGSALHAFDTVLLLLGAATGLALSFDAWGSFGAGAVLLGMGLTLLTLKRWMSSFRWRRAASLALAFALALEAVAVFGLGSYMRGRLAALDHDRGSRLQHWQNGLALMRSPADWIFGIGLGRLPAAYARAVPAQEFPGEVQFVQSGADERSGSVRLLGPKTQPDLPGLLALAQRVALRPVAPYQAAFEVRASAQADVYVRLCEVHLLYPRHCQVAFVRVPPGGADWRHITLRLRRPLLDAGHAWAPRLGVFSIAVINVGGAADFDKFSLIGADGTEALANRDFSQGLARWFPAAQGYYVPWHIDNLYLEVLIERGVPALLAFVLCMALALRRLVDAAGRAAPIAPFLAASLCGALLIGAVSSVMDAPRVAFLLFLLTLFAVEITDEARPRGT